METTVATPAEMNDLMTLLDRSCNMFGQPIQPENRARIFAAFDSPTPISWEDARSSLVTKQHTLWQAVIQNTDCETYDTPTRAQIVAGLRAAAEINASKETKA